MLPAAPPAALSALIVSVASVCRAPLAAAVFRQVARARAESRWHTDSAGLDPWFVGLSVDPRVTSALRTVIPREELWLHTTRKSRLVHKQDFDDFDYILGVDRFTMEALQVTAPPAERRRARLLLLPSFDPERSEKAEIRHPDDDEEGGFERCLHQCVRSCNGFLEHHGNGSLEPELLPEADPAPPAPPLL